MTDYSVKKYTHTHKTKLKCDNEVNVNVLVLQYGAALIVDEVQTGGGSTGHYW